MKHFLCIADLSPEEILHILDLSARLKEEWKKGGNKPILAGKTLGMIFQKPSLRTRVSFEMAMRHLGGHAIYLSPDEIQLGKRESVADVARVLSRYVDAIMARVFSHKDLEELARYSSVPVINGLSDYSHPCQAMGDIFTIQEKVGNIKGLKLAFVGDGNNVCNSLLFITSKLGMDMSVASPKGYEPRPEVVQKALEFASKSGSRITITNDPVEAVRDANIIYTDVWTSMGQEAEAEERAKVFPPYQVNSALVAKARPDVMVMHCLPAHRGQEITDEVADGPNSIIFDQAENRLHAQKGILAYLLAGM
ncbi:MAG: ornithine carbamoyltransferase [Anaerolineae bacterium]|nr:ornithine carbamoyltransferase [Anaerolineae bacterium]MDW8103124.1 ornithine carbamoyltransferase [Anaerolineae bacterium]